MLSIAGKKNREQEPCIYGSPENATRRSVNASHGDIRKSEPYCYGAGLPYSH